MITWKTIAALLAALVLVELSWAGESALAPPPVKNTTPVCVCAPYCYKPAPCVPCPAPGKYYACYCPKPTPCVTCPPSGNYCAPYCGKPAPVCWPPPPVQGCCSPPCRHPCEIEIKQ